MNHHWAIRYPLVNCPITMENHHFSMGKSTISMAIFNSYVSSPEGIPVPNVGNLFSWVKVGQKKRPAKECTRWHSHVLGLQPSFSIGMRRFFSLRSYIVISIYLTRLYCTPFHLIYSNLCFATLLYSTLLYFIYFTPLYPAPWS